MNISHLTERFGEREWWRDDWDRPALSLESDSTWSYRTLNDNVNRYANGLRALGVEHGERVGILLYNSLDYVALYLAVGRIGAVAVRLNFRLSPMELSYALNDSGCAVLCFHDELVDQIEPVRHEVWVREYVVFRVGDIQPDWARPESVLTDTSSARAELGLGSSDQDVAMLMYTSGTTGRPKAAVWTHETSMWFTAMQAIYWGSDRTTVAMTSGPLYHVGGLEDLLLPTLFARGHAIMAKSRGFSIERYVSVLEREQVTDAFLYPFMMYDFLAVPDLNERDLSSLRTVVTGGSAIASWAVDKFYELFPNVDLVQTYGMTEGGPIITGAVIGKGGAGASVAGRPIPFTDVLLSKDGSVMRGPLAQGEVWVRSPAVARGYWEKPHETSETFIDGWCKTGDLGRIDEEGYLVIEGRTKDMIKSGGENVYPAEIEQVIAQFPKVQDVAVIGVPDLKYQEGVCAVVVPHRGMSISEQEIVNHCRNCLAGYKKPRHVVVVDELPRTASGKVMKYRLRERYKDLETVGFGPHQGSTRSG